MRESYSNPKKTHDYNLESLKHADLFMGVQHQCTSHQEQGAYLIPWKQDTDEMQQKNGNTDIQRGKDIIQ